MTTLPTLSGAAIESDRVVLRKARDTDREGIVEVLTDPEVRVYLGGPRPRDGVERFLDQAGTASTTAAAGGYVIADRQTGGFGGAGPRRRVTRLVPCLVIDRSAAIPRPWIWVNFVMACF